LLVAKQLTDFKFMPRTRGRSSSYPWDEWFDGAVWKLTRGVDFPGDPHSFRTNAYAKARSRGLRLRAQVIDRGDAVVIQAVEL
jgi:hypothetical protein